MRFQPDEALDQMTVTIEMDRNAHQMVITLTGCEPQVLNFDECMFVLDLLDHIHQRVDAG
jgi:hypothetical protein